jgi:acetylornithine deacetylase
MAGIGKYIDESDTIDLLKNLIMMNSVNPSLVKGACGEAEIAEYVANYLKGMGLRAKIDEVMPRRSNAIGVLKGSGGGPTLMLNGHLDTVGTDYMEIDPFDPIVKEGRIYGRGSNDMKGGLAAMLAATKAIVDSGVRLKGDLILAGVCDEEYASIGTESLVKEFKADAAVITEPTQLNIAVAHKGFAWIDIETRGVAAHGSTPHVGVDAIAKMGKVLVEIERLQEGPLQEKTHRLVGSPSIHASTISGGRELSTYPDCCRLQVERRMIPGETVDDVDKEIGTILSTAAKTDPKFEGRHEITFVRGPMEVSSDEAICRTLHWAIKEVTGAESQFNGSSGWMDTEILWRRGTPSVAFGPKGEGSHAAVEYVESDSVIAVARILELTAASFCGTIT